MAENDADKALHYSEGKPGVDQIPVELLIEWGRVFSYGERKYFRDNWKRGNDWHEFIGSALRHLFAWERGQDLDPESSLPHLAHLIWNIGALRYYQLHGLGHDDRPLSITDEYVAGLFDGEGCVVVDKSTRGNGHSTGYILRVQITNTDYAILEKVKARWAGGITTQDRGVNKPVHVWQATSKQAVAFLETIRPFVHIKSLQVHRAIEFQACLRERGGGGKLTQDELAEREAGYQDLRELKKGLGNDDRDIIKKPGCPECRGDNIEPTDFDATHGQCNDCGHEWPTPKTD